MSTYIDPWVEEDYETQTLLRRKIAAKIPPISADVLDSMELSRVTDFMADRIVFGLKMFLYGEKIGSHTETARADFTVDWWDHFKLDHPKTVAWWSRWVWALAPYKRRVVQLSVTCDHWANFPEATYRPPPGNEWGPVRFLKEHNKKLEMIDLNEQIDPHGSMEEFYGDD